MRNAGVIFIMLIVAATFFYTGCVCAGTNKASTTEETYSVIEILSRMRKYQLKNPWRETDRGWIRPVYYCGLTAMYDASRSPVVFNQIVDYGLKHQWQWGTERVTANNFTVGQIYLELYSYIKSPEIIMPIREYVDDWIKDLKNSPPRRNREWCYSDALFVAPPTVAMLGHITGEDKYYEWLNKTYWHAVEVLQDKEDGFFYRDHRFIGKRNENGKKIFWSRGNGWVIAGIPRILEYLPKDNPYFARYTALLRQLAREAKNVQGEDGLWRPNLADSEHFSVPETSGSAFFCYGIAWGICEGYLDPDDYIKVVKKAWRALVSNVGEDGKLYYVQDVGDRPDKVEKEDTHEYGIGAFMLAGEQVIRLMKAGYLD